MKVFFSNKTVTKKAVDFMNFNYFGTIFAERERERDRDKHIFFPNIQRASWHDNNVPVCAFCILRVQRIFPFRADGRKANPADVTTRRIE
jgi:hypothetical protein